VVIKHASDRSLAGGILSDLRRQELDPTFGYARIIQHKVIGKGLNDYDAIFAMLTEAGFDRWISFEDGMNGVKE
jgi:sugar phosphate isomerase/epimerase